MDATIDTQTRAVMGNFVLEATLPNGKKFTVSGYLFEGEDLSSLNTRIDNLHDVVDRQRTKAEIPELEVKYDQWVKTLDQNMEHMKGLSDKKDSGKALSSQEKTALANLSVNNQHVMNEITRGRQAIDDARALVAQP